MIHDFGLSGKISYAAYITFCDFASKLSCLLAHGICFLGVDRPSHSQLIVSTIYPSSHEQFWTCPSQAALFQVEAEPGLAGRLQNGTFLGRKWSEEIKQFYGVMDLRGVL